MKNNTIWVIKKRTASGEIPLDFEFNRNDARKVADYMNGFSKGTKDAKYRVRKFVEVESDSMAVISKSVMKRVAAQKGLGNEN